MPSHQVAQWFAPPQFALRQLERRHAGQRLDPADLVIADAERAFGKDKAKKGYKAAQQQVFGGDATALQSPELAGKLPKV